MFHRRKRPYNTRNYGHDDKKFKSQYIDIMPDFSPSGLLELESNNKEGIALKHVEPQDAISPDNYMDMLGLEARDRTMYELVIYRKNDKDKGPWKRYDLNGRSCYLVGRELGHSLDTDLDDRTEIVVADIGIPEETSSKQHCVIQFRNVRGILKCYVMDLNSSNGTCLNNVVIPGARYIELRSGDVLTLSEFEEDTDYELIFMNV
ncbi:Pml1p [Saccharomyces cerevisiae YJM1527]|nr:Pml1p [Saccharomyces cerevisiae YJM1273]AJV64046.1 Pml1p [Saccharomyces cerevisiae YJM1434]AJV64941.1 Pml1p [Saccharomyces cerevisiae YJM1443]AJV65351.1 Pml1p [Saccharomyces cerevisiae YJM1444]AJV69393.1 Pml1p [Saccharomyces cerevisiae YJM1527]AJV75524.1 Pml1p [Saccharomyces cerevisiae YJM326]AJV79128.1 Pml1p [Saccharomyces cerevisiae YJM554]AJV80909.1 Pml1p [Saccharomyces cerevisiae YJM682]CAD6636803.1 BJ4_G0029400.mRNA.1.CDS.1 [Saccharomyces cerevisiae]